MMQPKRLEPLSKEDTEKLKEKFIKAYKAIADWHRKLKEKSNG